MPRDASEHRTGKHRLMTRERGMEDDKNNQEEGNYHYEEDAEGHEN